MLKEWIATIKAKRKAKKFAEAVKLVESQGLTVCEIASRAGTDYILGSDGSWHRIGRGK
jgi:deoxyribose-phosphate aldolase